MVLEDEEHVAYDCPRYNELRRQYEHLITDNIINLLLNPRFDKMVDTARYLNALEAKRSDLSL